MSDKLKILEQRLEKLLEGFEQTKSPDNQCFYHNEMEKIKKQIEEEKLK